MQSNVPFSRYFKPGSIFDTAEMIGNVGNGTEADGMGMRRDSRLISVLDEEQLSRLPSSDDWWSRRKSQLLGANDDENICPCISAILKEQLEEMNRIVPHRDSLDLTLVSQIDEEQKLETGRCSNPLNRFVSILDDEQTHDTENKEVVAKAFLKMKNLKCSKCEESSEIVNIPVVKIIPSTPMIHSLVEIDNDRILNSLPDVEHVNKHHKHHKIRRRHKTLKSNKS